MTSIIPVTSVTDSSISIFENRDISKEIKVFKDELFEQNKLDDIAYLRRLNDLYPELQYYNYNAKDIQKDIPESSGDFFQSKITDSFLRIFWLLQRNYQKFTEHQRNRSTKLENKTFEKLFLKAQELLDKADEFDIMLILIILQDLGKIESFRQKVQEKNNSQIESETEIILYALKQMPELVPSFSRLSKVDQNMLLNGFQMNYKNIQFVRGEIPLASLCAIQPVIMRDSRSVDYFVLKEVLDLLSPSSSDEAISCLTERECSAYLNAWEIISNSGYETDIYTKYLQYRGRTLEVNSETLEGHAIVRLACMSRFYTKKEGSMIGSVFESLPLVSQVVLKRELNFSGTDNEKATFLDSASQTLVNLLKGKSNQHRKKALSSGFLILAKLYQEARSYLNQKKEKGVYQLHIDKVAAEAPTDINSLKYKNIVIDFEKNVVTDIANDPNLVILPKYKFSRSL